MCLAECRYVVITQLEATDKYGWHDGFENDEPQISKVRSVEPFFIQRNDMLSSNPFTWQDKQSVGGMQNMFTTPARINFTIESVNIYEGTQFTIKAEVDNSESSKAL